MTLKENEFQYQDSVQSERRTISIEDKLESFIYFYMKIEEENRTKKRK